MTAPAGRASLDDAGLRQARLEHSGKNTWLALAIFAVPTLGYVVNFVGLLAMAPPWSLLLTISGAWFTGMMFVVGHDACHQSYTRSRRLNAVIGRMALLPSLHSFSLWDLGHNRIHHRHNNVRGFDYVWEPMSPGDYAAAGPWRRALYRFLHSPAGVFAYYLPVIWLPKMFLVRKRVYGTFRPAYLWDGILVWTFLGLETAAAVVIGDAFGRPAGEAILIAVILPFLIWNGLMSFVIYLHHTHPAVPWYASVEEWREKMGGVFGTVHVRFPWVVRKLMLDIMEHTAHHYAPGVPLYHLESMQRELQRPDMVEWRWSVGGFLDVTRRCRLFDFDAHRWIGYPSHVTAGGPPAA